MDPITFCRLLFAHPTDPITFDLMRLDPSMDPNTFCKLLFARPTDPITFDLMRSDSSMDPSTLTSNIILTKSQGTPPGG